MSQVVELRRYTLHPGRRDELIELFDREFVETQEAVGIAVLGQFRDLDAEDDFVWLRGFADMPSRHRALVDFYGGPDWAKHSDQANATMIDFSDVLLLRPAPGGSAGNFPGGARPPVGAAAPDRFVAVHLWRFPDDDEEGPRRVLKEILLAFAAAGSAPLVTLVTEPAANTFTRLPIRTGESVVVAVLSYPDEEAHEQHRAAVKESADSPEILRLVPTGRSLLR
jgi:hypothetical protein